MSPAPAPRVPALLLLLALTATACSGPASTVDAERGPVPRLAHAVIPMPAEITVNPTDAFAITPATPIVVDAGDSEAMRVGTFLSALVGNTLETRPPVVEMGTDVPDSAVVLTTRGADAGLGDEGYALSVTGEGVRITARTAAGLFYGVQTLRQLLPPAVEYTAAFPRPMRVPAARIVDTPRFGWRGAMLDVARHFLEPEDVKRYIDLMALYKLNRLHLHLSDDQGWRVEIPGRPNLTTHGGATEVGGGPGGFYTTAAYEDLVAYAAERFITVVPEIDMPGHTNAALASYAELNCDGQAPPLFTGTAVGFSTLCVEKEETYTFVDDVVEALAAMTPGPYFHLGGDEVHELAPEQYAAFMDRAQAIVARHGRRVVGWDELAEAAIDLAPGTVIQVWRPQAGREGPSPVAAAVARGATVVLSPADRVYLDMKYNEETVLGLTWAGVNPVRDAYAWEPTELIPGVGEAAIEGVEAPLWSETLGTLSDVEYMAFPRLAGVAEIGWSPAAARDWGTYRLRLGAHAPRWTALGVNFYRAPEVPWAALPGE